MKTVHNLTIHAVHTYYVNNGGNALLTHNTNCGNTGRAAANTGDEGLAAGKYLKNSWYKGTFPNRTQSVQYHLAKHGKGRTAIEYTQDAMEFFAQNRSLGQSVILRDGTAGIKISTKQPLPGGGAQKVGGYWTSAGRLIAYWD